MFKTSSLILLFLLAHLGVGAQVGLTWTEDLSSIMKSESVFTNSFSTFSSSIPDYRPIASFGSANKSLGESTMANQNTLDPLGLFCNLDLNLDQKLPFKLRFRLGEYHYTHQLEYGLPDLPTPSN